jgi:hypothetical protein
MYIAGESAVANLLHPTPAGMVPTSELTVNASETVMFAKP